MTWGWYWLNYFLYKGLGRVESLLQSNRSLWTPANTDTSLSYYGQFFFVSRESIPDNGHLSNEQILIES